MGKATNNKQRDSNGIAADLSIETLQAKGNGRIYLKL